MVALSTAFYARLSIGSRQIVEIFNILNEFMGNIFGDHSDGYAAAGTV